MGRGLRAGLVLEDDAVLPSMLWRHLDSLRAQLASGWAVDARAYHPRAYHTRAYHTRANHARAYHPRAGRAGLPTRAQHHPVRPVCAVRH